jgi:hemerythrin-like metal-binding protein
MQWKTEYSIGIEEIDEQHKELINLFSSVADAVSAEMKWSEIHFRIVTLRNFATFHFEFEEALMRLFGYAENQAHAEFHRGFFAKLSAFESHSIHEGVKGEVVKLLCDWLFGHILTSDKDYAKHILAGAAVVRTKP